MAVARLSTLTRLAYKGLERTYSGIDTFQRFLKASQINTGQDKMANYFHDVCSYNYWFNFPDYPSYFIAQEFFDALPVHQFQVHMYVHT